MFQIDQQPHIASYYASTANDQTRHPCLEGSEDCDVCIVGAGLTGISTALNLAERGYRVVVLEAARVGWAASGRNGGQMIYGYACGMDTFARDLPEADVKRVWEMGQESLHIIRERVARHAIDCALTLGYLTAANKPRDVDALKAWQEEAASRFGYTGFRYVEQADLRRYVQSNRYLGGLHDPDSGHLHPLNYTLGLARAAVAAGARIYEGSCVTGIDQGKLHRVRTAHGEVHARFVVLACNAYLDRLAPSLRRKIMPVGTYVIATEPLGKERAASLMPANAAVCDSRFVLDYYRRSADHRLLWGGKVSYSTLPPRHLAEAMRRDMLKTFPQLADVKIEHAWGGFVDITMSRAPPFRAPRSHHLLCARFLGAWRQHHRAGWQVDRRSHRRSGRALRYLHPPAPSDFPGGPLLRTPALVLAMAYYRLRDLL